MCGLFGALHCGTDDSATTVATTVACLGALSEERGKDAAGIAIIRTGRQSDATATRRTASNRLYSDGTVTVTKSPGTFTELLTGIRAILHSPRSAYLGHTRWATQGDVASLTNTSPLTVGHLVGTHNGDIDVTSVPDHANHVKNAFGGTDTEILYRAIDRARGDRRKITKLLRTVRGRAALAFINREDTTRLYLARGALSPLSYAYDTDGNFYYASNPNWFRLVAKTTAITFTEITLVPEGHLLTVNTETGEIEDVRRFTPTCREGDLALIGTSVYRNFDSADRWADQGLHRHRVATRLPRWPALTQVPVIRTTATPGKPAASTAQARPAAKPVGRVPAVQPPLFSQAPVTPSMNDRLAWEEPETWDAPDDPWATHDDPPAEYFEGLADDFDLDEVEELCWDRGQFDMSTYTAIVEADEADAVKMVAYLRQRREKAAS